MKGESKMPETKWYSVIVGEETYAECMSLDTATILAKGLFDAFYKEEQLAITIERKVPSEVCDG